MGGHLGSGGGRLDQAGFRNELLGRLGLRVDASDQDVETAHNDLVEFLELAPHEVRSWAAARAADVDEAFALLSGPTENLIAETAQAARGGPGEASLTSAPTVALSALTAFRSWWQNKTLRASLILVVAVAIVLGVYGLGRGSQVPGISGAPTNQTSGAVAPAAVDQVSVAALMKKISSNPKDIASLQALGDIYFAAADYQTATVWEQKVLAIDPKNQVALLALGAAQFNQGNKAEAKKQWLIAAALYPNLAEVHYDLGFLYFSQNPPDLAKVTAEWNKVIKIDPNSNIAKTVATHLKSLQSPSPSASVTPSQK